MKRIICLLLALALLLPALALAEETTPLAKGAKGDAVKKLQTRLIELNLLDGQADGVFGAATGAAVEKFEAYLSSKGYKIAPDAVAEKKTLKLLNDDEVVDPLLTLKLGDQGGGVTKLQRRLIRLGFLAADPDGVFGEKTRQAVLAFQKAMIDAGKTGIAANGEVDVACRDLIYSDLSDTGIAAPIYFDKSEPLSLKPGHVYAWSCIVADWETGRILFAKNPDERVYPASTTKIMTAVLALEDGNLGRSVTIPKSAADVPADSSLVPVSPGEVMTMKDLLYGMMIRSGNDAANAVATLTSGSVQDFVARMNARASELGMSGTHFTNPHGYHDADHYTTARDMLRLTRYALQSKTFRKILTTRSYTIGKTVNVTDKVTKLTSTKNVDSVISNTYDLLKPAYANYYPYALGGKTGYTYPAGQCFAGVARRDGRTVVIALFHSGLDKDDRWTDAVRLFEYGFAAIEAREKAA